ncbi:hypothetical protein A9Q79_04915 [Methylophaga sp. 42_25_T18]|nr:hypothetical protein A9Q79_04915 [Methylophaga sp. 42_25_T18]OUR85756.1 hypothetical protein A9Q92_07560 [Methylophaga sp. 42_8_T64]
MAAQPVLLPAWQATPFEQPESVVYDTQNEMLYVSNVNGDGMTADGNGYISTLSLSGEVIEQHWLTGLDAPKGMTIVGNNLYVADIKTLVVIDIPTKTIKQRYFAIDAKFLNDVAADKEGNVYVSGFLTNSIYRLKGSSFNIWLKNEQLEVPNGLLVEGDQLLIGSWGVMTDGFATDFSGHLKTVDIASKKITSLGDQTPAGNLDGVEPDGEGNYYVTDWLNGKLLHIQPTGISTTLLKLDQGSADQTVLLEQGLVIIPMMLSGNVSAFQIKQ